MIIDFKDSMWQEVLAEIQRIGKTLDEALVRGRNWQFNTKDENLIIIPPVRGSIPFYNKIYSEMPNLIMVFNFEITGVEYNLYSHFQQCPNLYYINFYINIGKKPYMVGFLGQSYRIRYFYFRMNPNYDFDKRPECNSYQQYKKLTMTDCKTALCPATSQYLNKEALVELLISLGTPETTQTLNLGSTNLAKLTAEEKAIATSKNWVLQ